MDEMDDYYKSRLNDRAARAAVRAGMLLLALVAALSFAAGHRASAAAQTDGSAPPTVIKGFVGDPFWGPNEDKPKLHTIQQTPNAQSAVQLLDSGWYRWYWWESGPEACIFTADFLPDAQHAIDLGAEAHHRLKDIGGGGSCGGTPAPRWPAGGARSRHPHA